MAQPQLDQTWRGAGPASDAAAPAAPRRWMGLLTVHDAVTLGYFAIVRAVLALVPDSAAASSVRRLVEAGFALAALGIAAARLVPRLPALVRAVAYRAGLVGALAVSYAALREQLPLVRHDAYDAGLLAIDRALFGVEPALWLERLNHPAFVEYIAFFYFSYYAVCASYMVVCTWVMRDDDRLTEFALGTLGVYLMAHLCYMLVPAHGPWRYLASDFSGPVRGGMFWSIVHNANTQLSPLKEIFPSMHTAGPTWFALHAMQRARTDRRWRWPAVVTAVVAAHIAFATVFLRWHYAIDVIAGLTLAGFASWAVPRIVRAERAWRERRGFGSPWPQSPWFSRA